MSINSSINKGNLAQSGAAEESEERAALLQVMGPEGYAYDEAVTPRYENHPVTLLGYPVMRIFGLKRTPGDENWTKKKRNGIPQDSF